MKHNWIADPITKFWTKQRLVHNHFSLTLLIPPLCPFFTPLQTSQAPAQKRCTLVLHLSRPPPLSSQLLLLNCRLLFQEARTCGGVSRVSLLCMQKLSSWLSSLLRLPCHSIFTVVQLLVQRTISCGLARLHPIKISLYCKSTSRLFQMIFQWFSNSNNYYSVANQNTQILSAPIAIVAIENNYDCSKIITPLQANQPVGTGYMVQFANTLNQSDVCFYSFHSLSFFHSNVDALPRSTPSRSHSRSKLPARRTQLHLRPPLLLAHQPLPGLRRAELPQTLPAKAQLRLTLNGPWQGLG